jgi:hypothetical protein
MGGTRLAPYAFCVAALAVQRLPTHTVCGCALLMYNLRTFPVGICD